MPSRPNILFLMTDQMRGSVLDPDSPCLTPTFDKLAERGVRITRAYTTSATCSPARASLMTGLLPHSHGVLQVVHAQESDKVKLDTSRPHWAQRLQDAGYRTGYFGKWHVEGSESPSDFGWAFDGSGKSDALRNFAQAQTAGLPDPNFSLRGMLDSVPGYPPHQFWGVTDRPAEKRGGGIVTSFALDWLDGVMDGDAPWCCCVSTHEPHDPFVAGEETFKLYDVDALPVPENWHDDLKDRPESYRKTARVFRDLSIRQRKEIAACYYAMTSHVDRQFARVIDRLEQAGQLDNTIVILTSDHGELLGAHGLYCKNISAYEEIYNIPMIVAGPGISAHGAVDARVGLHDVGPTLIDLVGLNNFQTPEARSFAPLLQDPEAHADEFATGYAEYYGTRFWCAQRIYWDGPWKLVWNGLEFDELYNLDDDPQELHNCIDKPDCAEQVRTMMRQVWKIIKDTDDHAVGNAVYPPLRLAPYGPLDTGD